jgi:hypothetical protein
MIFSSIQSSGGGLGGCARGGAATCGLSSGAQMIEGTMR